MLTHPDWSKNATMYQINLRQFTAEGTFHGAEKHLPRPEEPGADVLWLTGSSQIESKPWGYRVFVK